MNASSSSLLLLVYLFSTFRLVISNSTVPQQTLEPPPSSGQDSEERGTTSSSGNENTSNVVEVLKCFRILQELGRRIYIGYVGSVSPRMTLFDADGVEVSCNDAEQQRIRQKTDRRCMFSPIHCLFNKRLNYAKLLSKNRPKTLENTMVSNRLYFFR